MSSLGVVIPALSPDEDQLETYLQDLIAELAPSVIRIELDNPNAATLETVTAAESQSVEVNTVPYRRGKGAAITAGFEALDTDRVAFADADGSTNARELARIIDALDTADVAAGSRRHPDATVIGHQTFARRFLGDIFAWTARRFLDIAMYDYQCGAKALTAPAWEAVRTHLYEPGFAWDVELLAMADALDLSVVEIPITWEDRPGSTVAPIRTPLAMAHGLYVARNRAKRLQNSPVHNPPAFRPDQPALVDRENR